jgi:hypothetical protein
MTRERKEIMRKLDELHAEEQAEYELGCGFFSEEIEKAFRPSYDVLYDAWAATYGRTQKEHSDYVFNKQCEAYDAGRIPWSPYYGMSLI